MGQMTVGRLPSHPLVAQLQVYREHETNWRTINLTQEGAVIFESHT